MNPAELHDAQEIANMLATHTTDWTAQWKQQGLKEGHEQGYRQGESKILRRQLQRRFGVELPTWVDEKLKTADTDQLEAWADALPDAPTPFPCWPESPQDHAGRD
jgi:flagellar biosynthesis/type III secretory pathway protein FliH